MKCPVCDGLGGFNEYFGEGVTMHEECGFCNDAGKISIFQWISYHFWKLMPDWFWDLVYNAYHLFHKESESE